MFQVLHDRKFPGKSHEDFYNLRDAYKILVRKSMNPLITPRYRLEDNKKMDFEKKKMIWNRGLDWCGSVYLPVNIQGIYWLLQRLSASQEKLPNGVCHHRQMTVLKITVKL